MTPRDAARSTAAAFARTCVAAAVAGFSIAAVLATAGCKTTSAPTVAGEPVPDFVLQSINGTTRKLSNYRGKIVLVNLWATWCPPCIAELPVLDRLATDYADKGLVVLGLAGDDDPQTVRDFLAATPVKFEVLLDPSGAIGTRYGITGYPETFFVDREGRLREKIIGPLTRGEREPGPELIRKIEGLLGG